MPRTTSQKNTGSPHSPKSRKEEQEFGPGKKEIVICKDCSAVYGEKHWRHSMEEEKHLGEDKQVRFAVCPACQMKRDKTFEGQVIVENVPVDLRSEIERLIYRVGDRANRRDPMDRILDLRSRKNGFEVRTSENQLAISMGKQIARAYKKAKAEVQLSEGESVARVRVVFPKK